MKGYGESYGDHITFFECSFEVAPLTIGQDWLRMVTW